MSYLLPSQRQEKFSRMLDLLMKWDFLNNRDGKWFSPQDSSAMEKMLVDEIVKLRDELK